MKTRRRAKQTQRGNPHQLTLQQHVFPRGSIARFTNQKNLVEVSFRGSPVPLKLRPDNPIFCANRVWDQRAEEGYMREIEIQFQILTEKVVHSNYTLAKSDHIIISRFRALWSLRGRMRKNPPSDQKLNGIIEARDFSLDEQEVLEKNHTIYFQDGSSVPGHMMAGLHSQVAIDRETLNPSTWGIVDSPNRNLIVPDTIGMLGYVPIAPHMAFLASTEGGTLSREDALGVNKTAIGASTEYFFTKNLACALG